MPLSATAPIFENTAHMRMSLQFKNKIVLENEDVDDENASEEEDDEDDEEDDENEVGLSYLQKSDLGVIFST